MNLNSVFFNKLKPSRLIISIKRFIKRKFKNLGKNKSQELLRLVYEIGKRENINPLYIFKQIRDEDFNILKDKLIKRRYPQNYSVIEKSQIYLPKLEINPRYSVNFEEKFSLYPKYIYFERETDESIIFRRFRKNFPQAKFIQIESLKNHLKSQRYDLKSYNLRRQTFFIIKEKYDFFKSCPCTKNAISCNYYIFNLGFGCPYECVYCFLQEYTNIGGIIFPVNLEDYFVKFNYSTMKNALSFNYKRIGTGQFTDSLVYDEITEYSLRIIDYFRNYPKIYFELKTKSNKIKNLLKIKPLKNIVISWSLNPKKIIKDYEFYTATLEERITSAKICAEYGYSVGFHFDPIIYYPNWGKDYFEVIEEIFKNIKERYIVWISLGTFRFTPSLKKIIENRFPYNNLLDAELILDFDFKLRYPKYIRIMIYKNMLKFIRKYSKSIPVYLCMEENAIWREIFKKN